MRSAARARWSRAARDRSISATQRRAAVLSAKAMAALIADIRAGSVAPDDTVVFLHTGGAPALFAHAGLFD